MDIGKELASTSTFPCPLLIAHGQRDALTSAPASKAFIERCDQKDKEYYELEGLFHEIHNEVHWESLVADKYVHWIKQRL